MEDKQLESKINEILDKRIDNNGCLTNLAKSRLVLMYSFARMAFNNGNDSNGNWAKWDEMKKQLNEIDELIIKISSQQNR